MREFIRGDGGGVVRTVDDGVHCPFCPGWFVLAAEPAGTIVHSLPFCARFLTMEPEAFMTAALAAVEKPQKWWQARPLCALVAEVPAVSKPPPKFRVGQLVKFVRSLKQAPFEDLTGLVGKVVEVDDIVHEDFRVQVNYEVEALAHGLRGVRGSVHYVHEQELAAVTCNVCHAVEGEACDAGLHG